MKLDENLTVKKEGISRRGLKRMERTAGARIENVSPGERMSPLGKNLTGPARKKAGESYSKEERELPEIM